MSREEMISKVNEILNRGHIDKHEVIRHICTFEKEEALRQVISRKKTIEYIVREYFEILSLDISSKCRRKEFVTARWVMFVYYKSKNLTLQSIGDKFCRDHATVLNGIREFKKLYNNNDSYIKNAVLALPEVFTGDVIKLLKTK